MSLPHAGSSMELRLAHEPWPMPQHTRREKKINERLWTVACAQVRAATMDGSDADVLLRMRDQADNFEAKTDSKDDKLNDGNNYRGMMSAEDYKKRRAEVLEGQDDEARKREKVQNAVDTARQADRAAAAKEVKDREERERVRKQKLQRELEAAEKEEAGEAGEASASAAPKKKKKRKAGGAGGAGVGLSFDADEEDG